MHFLKKEDAVKRIANSKEKLTREEEIFDEMSVEIQKALLGYRGTSFIIFLSAEMVQCEKALNKCKRLLKRAGWNFTISGMCPGANLFIR